MSFRSRTQFLAVVVTTCAALAAGACAPMITNYAYMAPETYPARGEDAWIEVFDATLVEERSELGIDREYEVIARFEVRENLNEGDLVEVARQKAREIGGDAIIYREHDQNVLLRRRSTGTVLVLKYVDGSSGL